MQKTKTLSQLKKTISLPKGESGSTAYYPKSEDEQKFVDKHKVEVVDDANGNDDEVFKGTKTKTVDRTKERHGYSSPKDADVYEEIEPEGDEEVIERTLTNAEMKKREDVVKGMKKNLSGFKKQYGKDAESVMYATATKMAKEDVDVEGYDDEELDTALLELFVTLSEDNRQLMIEMLEDGLEEEILQIIQEEMNEEGEELNG